MPRLILILLPLVLAVLPACGDKGEIPADETPGEGDATAGVSAAGGEAEATTPQRWPRPIPPEPYGVVEVEDAGVVVGAVSARKEGRGVAFEHPAGEACPDGVAATAPTYPAGSLAGAAVTLADVREGVAVVERAPSFAVGACDIEPRVALATTGAEVRFRAADGEAQEVRWIAEEGYRDMGAVALPADGAEVGRRARAPGRVHLRGEPHRGTRGWLVVVDHPYAAITGADGTFRLEGVPAGEHTLVVWHEAFAAEELTIQVTAGAELRQDVALSPNDP